MTYEATTFTWKRPEVLRLGYPGSTDTSSAYLRLCVLLDSNMRRRALSVALSSLAYLDIVLQPEGTGS